VQTRLCEPQKLPQTRRPAISTTLPFQQTLPRVADPRSGRPALFLRLSQGRPVFRKSIYRRAATKCKRRPGIVAMNQVVRLRAFKKAEGEIRPEIAIQRLQPRRVVRHETVAQ